MKKIALTLAIICLFGIQNNVFSQSLPGFDDDVNDETVPAPITKYLLLGLIAGSIFGIKNKK